ncbi:MAG: Type IV pilus assembly protein PilM [candidate division WS6 bacterium GW2011_GWF2_39_15]|uniref:Type IV pilus assembly protein PilM n=1 Tax=candidate division WS6 bacterium GW2011_GWF2_39_15 TaxID=1619100 RepID=A0A0G0MSU9_9BACT|nr:MAG: Type IV pilus assembly protein PilM [candidate division WS6 bacterium GW2011_GWF2_39_15]
MSKLPDHVGIDFGNHSVKAVELKGVGTNSPELINFGSQRTPHGVINSEDDMHQNQLADAVKTLFSTAKMRNKLVVMALPESSIFTRFLEFPGVKEEELENAVYYQAKEYIPMPIDDVHMNYVPLGINPEKNAQKVLLVAAPKKIIQIYQSVALKAGLEPIAIETESIAIGRSMFRSSGMKHVVMLDFGATSTDMSIMLDGQLVFSQSIAIGSDSLTQTIVNKFNFEYQQAEEYKRNYGVVEGILEGKMYATLSPILEAIMNEVSRGIEFYKNKTLSPAPNNVLLSGDGALLPGLADYISKVLGVSAVLSDPWKNIAVPDKFRNIVTKSASSYSVAIGLALKDE